jgi:alkylhydroperoxidase family enzyme
MDINSARAAEANGNMDKVGELLTWRDSKLFSEAERVALEYAERITYTDQKVDDALFTRLRQHYSEPQIVEPKVVVAFENFRSKFNPPLGIEAQGFCMVPGAGTKKAG